MLLFDTENNLELDSIDLVSAGNPDKFAFMTVSPEIYDLTLSLKTDDKKVEPIESMNYAYLDSLNDKINEPEARPLYKNSSSPVQGMLSDNTPYSFEGSKYMASTDYGSINNNKLDINPTPIKYREMKVKRPEVNSNAFPNSVNDNVMKHNSHEEVNNDLDNDVNTIVNKLNNNAVNNARNNARNNGRNNARNNVMNNAVNNARNNARNNAVNNRLPVLNRNNFNKLENNNKHDSVLNNMLAKLNLEENFNYCLTIYILIVLFIVVLVFL